MCGNNGSAGLNVREKVPLPTFFEAGLEDDSQLRNEMPFVVRKYQELAILLVPKVTTGRTLHTRHCEVGSVLYENEVAEAKRIWFCWWICHDLARRSDGAWSLN